MLSKRPIQSISAIVFGPHHRLHRRDPFQLHPATGQRPGIGSLSAQDQQLLITLSLAVVSCYICVMVIYKTRDRFRFIIPYVEFQKEEKGARPVMIDTSAVIDGRLAELCETRLFDTTLIIPKFVLQELQHVADSADRLRRNRGRRGLEMLQRLQRDERLAIQIHDGRAARGNTVDSKLVKPRPQAGLQRGRLGIRVAHCRWLGGRGGCRTRAHAAAAATSASPIVRIIFFFISFFQRRTVRNGHLVWLSNPWPDPPVSDNAPSGSIQPYWWRARSSAARQSRISCAA